MLLEERTALCRPFRYFFIRLQISAFLLERSAISLKNRFISG